MPTPGLYIRNDDDDSSFLLLGLLLMLDDKRAISSRWQSSYVPKSDSYAGSIITNNSTARTIAVRNNNSDCDLSCTNSFMYVMIVDWMGILPLSGDIICSFSRVMSVLV